MITFNSNMNKIKKRNSKLPFNVKLINQRVLKEKQMKLL